MLFRSRRGAVPTGEGSWSTGLDPTVLTLAGARVMRLAAAVACPTMLVHATEDAMVGAAEAADLASVLGTEPLALPDAGHQAPVSHAGELWDLVGAFLLGA